MERFSIDFQLSLKKYIKNAFEKYSEKKYGKNSRKNDSRRYTKDWKRKN